MSTPDADAPQPVDDVLRSLGFKTLGNNPSMDAIGTVVAKLAERTEGETAKRRALLREGAIQALRVAGIGSPASIVDTHLNGSAPAEVDPDARVLPPPAAPLTVARHLAADLYIENDNLVLREWRGDFYRYAGSYWPEADERVVRADAYRYLEHAVYLNDEGLPKPWRPTRAKILNLLDALAAVTILDTSEPPTWTDDREGPPASEIVSMENGLLHLPTRKLLGHSPTFFNHHALPFSYDPDAPKPTRWLSFLDELWPEDRSSIVALQEVFGYILGGDTSQQKIFMLVGPKRAGKGTIARVLTGLLGTYNVAAPTLASLATNFGLQPLLGKPLALIADARLGSRGGNSIVVERLLSISGEDSLTIDRKYRDPWTGRLPTRFLILTNELPRLSDSSGALASRFIVFVLTRSFYGKEDPGLTKKLLSEAPGIFNWALEGLARLNERGYFVPPESGRDAVRELEDLASPVSAFVRERCVKDPKESVPVNILWTAWKAWCEAEGRGPGTKAVLGRNLRAAIPSLRKTHPRGKDGSRVYVYEGLGLREYSTSAEGEKSTGLDINGLRRRGLEQRRRRTEEEA